MVRRTIAPLVGLITTSIAVTAYAGSVTGVAPYPVPVDVSLTPDNSGPYFGGETVTVDVSLTQRAPSGDVLLRLIQFDFDASSPELQLNSFAFDFSAQQICVLIPALCGTGYASFPSLTDSDGKIVSTIFTGTAADPFTQISLPATGTIMVGHISITLPPLGSSPATYVLDAIDAQGRATDPNHHGAALVINFDFSGRQFVPVGTPLEFTVVPEPATLALIAIGAFCIAHFRRVDNDTRRGLRSPTPPACIRPA